MRLIKMVGLAAIAVTAAMAFLGASTASAESLCEEFVSHETGKCLSPLAEGKELLGLTLPGKPALLLTNLEIKMECHSSVLGLVKANEGAHKGLWVLIEDLLFTNCSGLCPKATGHANALLLLEALPLDAWLTEHPDAAILKPGALLEECTAFKVNCLYHTTNAKQLLLIVSSAATSELVADKVPLLRSGHSALCPATAEWDAAYLVALDVNKAQGKLVWLAPLP